MSNSSNSVGFALFVLSTSMFILVATQRRSRGLIRLKAFSKTSIVENSVKIPSSDKTPNVEWNQKLETSSAPYVGVSKLNLLGDNNSAAVIGLQDGCNTCDCEAETPAVTVTNNMLGSVKSYDRHVIICVPAHAIDNWKSDIDEQSAEFPYNLIQCLEDVKKTSKALLETANDAVTSPALNEGLNVPAVSTQLDCLPSLEINQVGIEKSVIDKQNAIVNKDTKRVKNKEEKKGIKLKVTALLEPSEVAENASVDEVSGGIAKTTTARILVYPDNIVFTLQPDQMQSFAALVSQPNPLRETDLSNYQQTQPDWKALILVCVHNARDKRCGRAGPQVIAELQKRLEERKISTSEVVVRGSSHIGGHAFAGTLIVYPAGQWYGRITKSNANELLDNVLSSKVYEKCSRGATSSKLLQW